MKLRNAARIIRNFALNKSVNVEEEEEGEKPY
jgi:hypothetical protein